MLRLPDDSGSSGRLHGFDALRAAAILLVLLLHAAVPYLVRPVPGLLWPTRDATPAAGIDALFWWIECFSMAVFFAMSGFFAARLLRLRGPGAFLAHRCRRVLMPLLGASAVILPLTLYVWVLGWVLDGKYAPVKLRSLKFDPPTEAHLWGFAHLWYVQYLFVYCVAFWGASHWAARRRGNGRMAGNPLQPRAILFAGPAVCAAMLWLDPRIVVGFHQSIVPVGPRLLYYGAFFAAGAWLYHRRDRLEALKRYHAVLWALSLAVFAVLLPLIEEYLDWGLLEIKLAVFALLIAAFAWLTTGALFGLFAGKRNRPGRAVLYVAEASYWLYLVHVPILGATHIALARTGWSAWIKFGLSFALTLGVTLAGYQWLARGRKLGVWLGGAGVEREVGSVEAGKPLSVSSIGKHIPDRQLEAGDQLVQADRF